MLGPQFMPGGGGSSTPEPPEMLFIKIAPNTAPTLEQGDFVKCKAFYNPDGSLDKIIEGFFMGTAPNDPSHYNITENLLAPQQGGGGST